MQTPKVGKKFAKLPGAPMVFGKLRAALRSTGAFSASSEQVENLPAYEATEQYRAYRAEVEFMKATAEQYAQTLRRRLV